MSHLSNFDYNTQCCNRKWCVRDGCGIVCAVITWLLLGYGQFCVITIMLSADSGYPIHQFLNGILFNVFWFLAFSSHITTMLTDPGAVPKGNATEDHIKQLSLKEGEVIYKCSKCASIKPDRAHHCSVCQRCIRKMDHHCPWVNNCIGEQNQKNFVLFTMYIALVSMHALYWGIWHFLLCVSKDWQQCSLFSPPTTTILLVFLLFESLLFSIFTLVMFGTQIHGICNDETGIEQLKHELFAGIEQLKHELFAGIEQLKHEEPTWERRDKWKSLANVFGGRASWSWLWPFALPYVSKKPFEYAV